MSDRFTQDGSDALEAHLALVCAQVREGVQLIIPADKLEGLVLAGGYGRGEGGVLRTDNGDAPYNDLEFFVFVRGNTLLNDRRYRAALHRLGETLTPLAGIDVEFKILSIAKLSRSEPSMFYYDLVMGHRWLVGDDSLFAGCAYHREAFHIPLHEATRLLFNRCSGLLYAKERLQRAHFTDDDANFVARNIAKAKLALGDVWLTMHGAYHWSCSERLRRLRAFSGDWAARIVRHHQAGVSFKLHPQEADAGMKDWLASEHKEITSLAELLWLHLEGHRIRRPFRSAQDYALTIQSLCPERTKLKNSLTNLRAFGLRGLLSRYATRYPRERLLRALSLLLWGETNEDEAAIVSACLDCTSRTFGASVQAYETLWHRFN